LFLNTRTVSFSSSVCWLWLNVRVFNCQSNFRLKVFLLFLTPTVVSFFFYSFFCFSHASILPDFLNWLFTLPPLHMPPHATLCSSSRVPVVVFQHSCSSSRVPAVVFQHSFSNIRVPAVVFQQSCSSSRVPAVVFQHLCFQQSCSSSRVPALVFQHSCSSSRVQQSCSSIRVPAFVFQQSCSSIRVPAVVFQHLCSSIRVCICVAAVVFAFVLQHLFSINRLPSMKTLIICVILLLSPYLQQFGVLFAVATNLLELFSLILHFCYNPKMHHTGLPGIRPTHASS
jgi:hypothetical protein